MRAKKTKRMRLREREMWRGGTGKGRELGRQGAKCIETAPEKDKRAARSSLTSYRRLQRISEKWGIIRQKKNEDKNEKRWRRLGAQGKRKRIASRPEPDGERRQKRRRELYAMGNDASDVSSRNRGAKTEREREKALRAR